DQRRQHVAEAREGPEVEPLVAVERHVVTEPAVDRVRILVELVREGVQLHEALMAATNAHGKVRRPRPSKLAHATGRFAPMCTCSPADLPRPSLVFSSSSPLRNTGTLTERRSIGRTCGESGGTPRVPFERVARRVVGTSAHGARVAAGHVATAPAHGRVAPRG